eukprot:2247114-Pyramimonas_sp.AAC.1
MSSAGATGAWGLTVLTGAPRGMRRSPEIRLQNLLTFRSVQRRRVEPAAQLGERAHLAAHAAQRRSCREGEGAS